jgi:CheY-like chemotaxis protein/HPt (histidine-containing phosphotransfer) domain-containing protein
VRTGSAALAALRAAAHRHQPFGRAIIDNSLPDIQGLELARTIKSASATADFQVIMLTSLDQEIGESEGALRRLSKPIRQSALWDCLASEAVPTPRYPIAAPEIADAAGARVLLVEDSPVNLEVGVAILESMGCKVETAVNGLHALERHACGEFSLIFMDCQMPEMDGFDTTIEIRRREAVTGCHTPIVALTASVVEDGRERCLAVGMDDYLAKPFTLDQMKAMLTIWLNQSGRPARRDRLSRVTALPAPSDPIDDQVLGSLRRLQREGRPDIVQQVIGLFFKGAEGLLKDLDDAAANGDAAQLCRASHALRSASANVGATILSARCKELEALARSGAVSEAQRIVNAIREDYRAAEVSLSRRLPEVA